MAKTFTTVIMLVRAIVTSLQIISKVVKQSDNFQSSDN